LSEPLKGKYIFERNGFKQEDVASAVKWLKEKLRKNIEKQNQYEDYTAGIVYSLARIDEAFEDVLD